jgi:zinc protease
MRAGRYFLLGLTLLLIYSFAFAGETKQVDRDHLLPAGVSIHVLNNGLQVLLIENPILPMTGINVAVKIGSAYENFTTSGMSHMLEHLLFNGTTNRSQKQLYDDVDLIGGYNNANTSYYYTNYMMVIPAHNTQKGMEIQADMLFNSLLPVDKFEKEKGIVLEEIAKDLNDPETEAENNICSILFPNHSLSLPVTGTYSTIESMSRDDVYAFYKNTYVPNNMILSAIGPLNTDSMLVLIKEIYGSVKPDNVEYPRYVDWKSGLEMPATINGGPTIYHRFYRGEELQVQMFFEIPVYFSAVHLTMLDEIFTKNYDGVFANLQKKFPGKIKSLDFGNLHYPVKNYFSVTLTLTNDQNIQRITEYIRYLIADIKLVLPPETVTFLATKARTDYLLNLEKPHMFGIYNAETLVLNGMESIFYQTEIVSFREAEQQLQAYRIDSKPVIIVQHPERKGSGQEKNISIQQKVFSDSVSSTVLIARQNPASNLLAIHYLFKHKAKYESQFGKNAAQILHDCFGQRLSSTANQKISNRFGLTFKVNDDPSIPMDDIYLHPDFGYIRAEGLADDLPGAIGYLTDQMNTFIPTRDEFNKALEKSKRLTEQGMGKSKTSEAFTQSYTNAVYEADVFQGSSKEINYEDLLKFRASYFSPDNVIISAVSPAGPDSLFKLFSEHLPAAKKPLSGQEGAYIRALKILPAEIKNEYQGHAEQSYLFWGFTTAVQAEDQPALEILSQLLADRIIFNVREKQGRAYRLNAGIEMVKDKALFYFRLGTRPANIDVLLPQIPGFFDPAVVNSITSEELQKTVNQYLGRMMFRRLSSINQAYYLAHSLYFYGASEYDQKFLDHLQQVSLEDIKRVARSYMVVKNPATIIMR